MFAVIDYINHRGERRERRIAPQRLWYGQTEYHPGDQWLLDAWDCEKQTIRTFAMSGIHAWRDANATERTDG